MSSTVKTRDSNIGGPVAVLETSGSLNNRSVIKFARPRLPERGRAGGATARARHVRPLDTAFRPLFFRCRLDLITKNFFFFSGATRASSSPSKHRSCDSRLASMGDEVLVDKDLFHERLSAFTTQWKADKRAGDGLFNGVGSIVVCVAKANEGRHTKTSAMQASRKLF